MNLKDKTVVISGGTGGLGHGVTEAFLKAEAKTVVTFTKKEQFEALKSSVGSNTGELLGIETNVLDNSSIKSMVEQVTHKSGRINVLVNLVGGYLGGVSIADSTEDQWDNMINLNLKSTFLCCRNVLPVMMKQNIGRIINIGSKGGLQGDEGIAAYAASKAAVINLTQSLAAEGRPYHITANVVIPGTIDTPANRKGMPKADFSRWVTPQALAIVILFLSSDEAKDINGSIVPVFGNV